jgi:hypothetical protein
VNFIRTKIFYCSNIGAPRVANWPPNLKNILFLPWGQVRAIKRWIKKIVSFSAVTPIVKPLGLISVIAPIGMLDLSSTLALTPNVKVGLSSKRWGMSEKIRGNGKEMNGIGVGSQ